MGKKILALAIAIVAVIVGLWAFMLSATAYETSLPLEAAEYLMSLDKTYDTYSGLPTSFDLLMKYGNVAYEPGDGWHSESWRVIMSVPAGTYFGKSTYTTDHDVRFIVTKVFVLINGSYTVHYVEGPWSSMITSTAVSGGDSGSGTPDEPEEPEPTPEPTPTPTPSPTPEPTPTPEPCECGWQGGQCVEGTVVYCDGCNITGSEQCPCGCEDGACVEPECEDGETVCREDGNVYRCNGCEFELYEECCAGCDGGECVTPTLDITKFCKIGSGGNKKFQVNATTNLNDGQTISVSVEEFHNQKYWDCGWKWTGWHSHGIKKTGTPTVNSGVVGWTSTSYGFPSDDSWNDYKYTVTADGCGSSDDTQEGWLNCIC